MNNLITEGIIPTVRIVNTILIISTTAIWIYAYLKCKEPGMLAPLTWLINVLGFYIFRFFALNYPTQANINLINLWSSIIILHGIILLILGAWIVELEIFKNPRRKEK